jgi:diguanylate cyclase (GGDEF)-like protein/PAS domain S-box-containing protein
MKNNEPLRSGLYLAAFTPAAFGSAQPPAEAHCQAFFDLAPDLLSVADGKGRLLKVSRSWTDTLGWSEAELTGQPYLNFVHPDDQVLTHAEEQRLRVGSAGTRFVNRYRHKNGGYRRLEWHTTAVAGPLYHSVVRDVTDETWSSIAGMPTESGLTNLSHLLMESSEDCIKILDLDGSILTINRIGCQRMGIPDPKPVAGRHLTEFWSGKYHAMIREAIEAARAGGTGRASGCCPTLQGDIRWWDALFTPIRDLRGAVSKLLVVARDVTELRAVEFESREQANRLTQITDSVPAIIFQWYARSDGKMGFSYLSDKCEMFGLRRDDLLADWTRIGIHPEDWPALEASIDEVVRARAPWQHACRLLLPDGSIRWVRNRSTPTHADDDIVVYTGVILDVTAEVLHVQNLARQEEKIRLLVENVSDAFIGMNDAGTITEWNRQAETLLGWSAAEAIGRDMLQLIGPAGAGGAHCGGLQRFLKRGQADRQNRPVELPLRAKAGHEVVVEMTVGEVRQEGSSYFATFLRDISERKALELKLQHQASHDFLTDLPNRASFVEALGRTIGKTGKRRGTAVLFIDLDGFKQVNDTLGHAAGDRVLREFAQRLRGAVRSTDLLSRFAGDEFAVLLNHLHDPAADALAIAQDILAHASEPIGEITRQCPISASVGVALLTEPLSAEDLLARADSAMYVAKRSGKNRVAIWKPPAERPEHETPRRLGAPRPGFEAARLTALHATRLLDSEPEEMFDRVTRLASSVLNMPIALISLVDEKRQWFKSRCGLATPETPRELAFCAYTILADAPMVISDTWNDPRFAAHPLVTGDPKIRFYAGVPLRAAQGQPIGSLCVIDRVPRQLSAQQLAWLEVLASTIGDLVQLRQAAHLSSELLAEVPEAMDASARSAMANMLPQVTMQDALTGLPNRTLLETHLRGQIEHWHRQGRKALLTVIDVDNLNGINQALGHRAGDRVLVTLAERLNSKLKAPHAVARIGGDMFMLLLADLESEAEGVAKLHELHRFLQMPFRLCGRSIDLSCTMGYAAFPRDGHDAETLFNTADAALRYAKSLGHGSIEEYADGPWRPQTRMLLEQDLRHALQRKQLFLEYQPKVNLANGQISGFEALIRWKHPERGLVSPAEFIPIAEESGLIVPIGEWVLNTACAEVSKWRELWGASVTMAVNLSARQFRERDLVQSVERALKAHQLPAGALELELTETASMLDGGRTITITHQLRELGVKLSIDDYGTGFSSLSYLKDLAVDKIKIDRSFVTDIASDAKSMALLESILDTARRLGLQTTAEGVETQAQLALLQKAGCTEYQGFLFSRPISPCKSAALLLQYNRGHGSI